MFIITTEYEIIITDQGKFEKHPKTITNVDGFAKQIYLLPQPDLEVPYTTTRQEKNIIVSDNPSMVSVRAPMLDDTTGLQREYEVTRLVYEQIPVLDEEGNETGEFTNGEPIGHEGTGKFLKLWTSEMQQEVDGDGNPLYWNTIEEEAIRSEKQPDIEITEDHEQFIDGLELAYDLIPYVEPPQPEYKSTEQKINEWSKEVEQLSEKVNVKNADEIFLSLDVANTTLEEMKQKKIEQLSHLCNQDILNGFISSALGVAHTYGFDYEAQQNLSAMLTLMNADVTLASTQWKTDDAGILLHSREEFLAVCKDAQVHKQNKIAAYWTKKYTVLAMTTKEDILTVNWDD